jgi:hypothetical protein
MINYDIETKSTSDKFDHLLKVISSNHFLNMKSLGNEIPFFICPYKVSESEEMERLQSQLSKKLHNEGIKILSINLYDLCVEILKNKNLWDRIIDIEPNLEKEDLFDTLRNVLNPEDYLVPAIDEKIQATNYDVLFINGVGEVYPYIRSHAVLNNLEKTTKKKPMVMFFPGTYTYSKEVGATLKLFGELHDDKYYRAFNIFEYIIPKGDK